jgi:uncharacterized protein (DUF2141 family)
MTHQKLTSVGVYRDEVDLMTRASMIAVLFLGLLAGSLGCGGTSSTACVPVDDDNPCTDDVCENDAPVHVPKVNSTTCHDGMSCTPRVDYPVGGTPHDIVAADLNGDDKPELAILNHDGNSVSMLINKGDGEFAAKVDYVFYNASSIGVGDMNGDGRAEIVVVGGPGAWVLSDQGNGTFASLPIYTCQPGSGWSFESISVADLNGDGKLDLAAADKVNNIVSVLLNKGDGTLADPDDYDMYVGSPRSIAAADLNGDGKLDLVFRDDFGVSALLNQGSGIFDPPVEYYQDPASEAPEKIAVADMNGDGKPDLVVVSAGVTVLLNQGGAFAPPVYSPAGLNPTSAAVADMNGDGKLDVTATNYGTNSVSVAFQQSDGTFNPAIEFNTGVGLGWVAAADLDSDGKTDLAVSNNNIGNADKDNDTISVLLDLCFP